MCTGAQTIQKHAYGSMHVHIVHYEIYNLTLEYLRHVQYGIYGCIVIQFIKTQYSKCVLRKQNFKKIYRKILHFQYSQKRGAAIFVSVGLSNILFDKSL